MSLVKKTPGEGFREVQCSEIFRTGEFMMDDPGTLEDCRRWLKAATSNPDVQVKSKKVFFNS